MTWEQHILLLREAEGLDSRLGDVWCTFPPLLRTVATPRPHDGRARDERGQFRLTSACRKGHPWTAETTYTDPAWQRRCCRICRRDRKRRWNQKRRAA